MPGTRGSDTAGFGGFTGPLLPKEAARRLSFFGSVALLHIPSALRSVRRV